MTRLKVQSLMPPSILHIALQHTSQSKIMMFFRAESVLTMIGILLSVVVGAEEDSLPDTRSLKTRIIGGDVAEFGRYPYHVDLDLDSGFHQCGGSLIAPNMVLTAAHCNIERIVTAKVGRYNKENVTGDFDELPIIEKIPHPLYNDELVFFDFMLMILGAPSDNEILRLNRDPLVPVPDQNLTLVGFGDIDPDTGMDVLPSVPHEVIVKAISNNECERSKSGFFERYRGRITEVNLCAADTGRDACQGDSGGPLIVKGETPDQDVLVGIVSWGFGCAHPLFPGVNARVSHEIDWITTIVCERASVPPPEFDCENFTPIPPPVPTMPPAPQDPILLTVEIKLDRYPHETGWLLEQVVGLETKTIASVPFFTYPREDFIQRNFSLEEGGLYNFILADAAEDGIDDGFVGLVLDGEKIILDVEGADVGAGLRHFFFATLVESGGSTYQDPDFPGNAFLTFQIELDGFPYETGLEVRQNSDGSLIFYRPPGFYQKTQLVEETFSVPLLPQEYTLTVADINGDGLTNTAGYALFQGDPKEGNLLVRSEFTSGFREETVFTTIETTSSGDGLSTRSLAFVGASLFLCVFFMM